MDRLRAAYNAWLERTNPLAGLSVRRAQSLYDAARAWGSPRLQYTYDEIELTDPVLLTCTERRAAAIAGMGWKFRARAAADATLAQEQRDALQNFANDIENLTEALEHLDLAFFRGFSHVQPIWDGGKVQRVALLKSWNFLRTADGTWWWDPECRETPHGLTPVGPEARLVTVTRRRAIDYPALAIHIRHALGERDWGRFLERYGIPPADITMAPNATEADRPRYESTADAAKDGRNIVLPNGATVSRAGETRGANPFLDFCEYQAKQILILATGGTLATLAEGDTGTLAGNAQENVWRQIVARDGAVISDALNRSLFRPFLAQAFPGRPPCVDFELGEDRTPSAEEVFDLAAKARNAGYLVDRAELEEATGYTLEKDDSATQTGLVPGLARLVTAPASCKQAKTPLQNARTGLDGQGDTLGVRRVQGADLGASAADELLAEVARTILDGSVPFEEALKATQRKLDAADIGTLAQPLEEALEKAMFEAAAEKLAEAQPTVVAQNRECRAADPAHCPTHGTPREPRDKGFQDRYGNGNPETLAATPEMNIERGKAVITHLMARRSGHEDKAMFRKDTGWIGIDYGTSGNPDNGYAGGHGLAHIAAKHNGAEKTLVVTLQEGVAYKHPTQRNKIILLHGDSAAVLVKERTGRLLITDYEKVTPAQAEEYTSGGRYHAKGEN